ncbi:hypothetical protein BH10BDE1_BH10BDE1_31630 [soil metagenome]
MSALRYGVLCALILLTGCASYQVETEKARKEMIESPAEAATRLEPLAKEEGKDQLLYMLNYATALQLAGRNAESAKEFIAAEKVADLKDYHSVSRVAGSLLLSEEVVQYKGDDFEKVLINGMNAMNYLEMGELDDALVEVRRVNDKLMKLKVDGKKEFNQSPFAFYLGAMIWEADRKYDDAYISYKQAYEVAPNYRPLREDLIRAAIKAQRPEELETWRKAFPEVQIKPEWKDRNRGEVVLVFANGWGPRKYPRFDNHRFPQLVAGFTPVSSATLSVFPAGNKDVQPIATTSTASIYSVNDVAIKALEADYARLVASRIAGAVTKAVVADQLRQKNELLGAVAWIALSVSDRADLRQWSTLPATFQIARASVNPGKYTVRLKANGSAEEKTVDVEVKPGRKAFLVWRVLD